MNRGLWSTRFDDGGSSVFDRRWVRVGAVEIYVCERTDGKGGGGLRVFELPEKKKGRVRLSRARRGVERDIGGCHVIAR